MNRYKHSGTLGDIIYSLAVVKEIGKGEFYLHLNQIDWIVQYFYRGTPDPFHQGKMTKQDFEFMKSFMEQLEYIEKFDILNNDIEITHNLDRFRPVFVGHPGNYVDMFAAVMNIDQSRWQNLRNSPWLSVTNPKVIKNKSYVINRSLRWTNENSRPVWDDLKDQGAESQGIFVGLPNEHQEFEKFTGWKIDYHPTKNLLELAEVIAGCEQFIGNQSLALSLAIGLGKPFACESRIDLPPERNECFFPDHPNGDYFY